MNQKAVIPILAVLLVVAAGAFWWLNKPAKSLDLYKYYPKETAFYVEVAPGEKRVTQVLDFIQEQADKQAAMGGDFGAGPEAAMLESSMNKALTVNKERQREQLKKVVENFNATFEPNFSIGAWLPADKPAATPEESNALVVFALRKDMSVEEFAQRFDLKLEEFDKKEFKADKPVTYLVDKQEHFAYAIADQKFMVTNNEESMTQALDHHFKKGPNVYDDPVNKEYVAMLSDKREGTFLLNNRIYADTAKQMREQLAGQSPVQEEVMTVMIEAFPITVGAIELDTENQMSVHFISPVLAENVKDEALRGALQSMYQNQQPLDDAKRLPEDTAFYVAVVGIDNIYDFYTQHLLTSETMGQMRMAEMMLNGSGLDLRQDLIGLFADKTVVAGNPQDQSMMLVLDKNEQKVATLGKINTLLQQFIKPQTDTIENISVTMVPMPTGNRSMTELAFGEVDDTIVFAPSSDFAEAVKAGKGQAGNLGQNATFKALMRDIPSEGNFLMYLNVAEMPNPSNQPKPFEAVTFGVWSGKKDKADLIEGQLNVLFPEEQAKKAG